MKVILLSRANNEIASAALYYLEAAGARIADRFLDEVKAARAKISEAPERYHIYRKDIRVARLVTFPYSGSRPPRLSSLRSVIIPAALGTGEIGFSGSTQNNYQPT